MKPLRFLGYNVNEIDVSWLQNKCDRSYFYRIGYIIGNDCLIAQDCINYMKNLLNEGSEIYNDAIEGLALVIIMQNNTDLDLDLIIENVSKLLSGEYYLDNKPSTLSLQVLIDELKEVCDRRTIKLDRKYI